MPPAASNMACCDGLQTIDARALCALCHCVCALVRTPTFLLRPCMEAARVQSPTQTVLVAGKPAQHGAESCVAPASQVCRERYLDSAKRRHQSSLPRWARDMSRQPLLVNPPNGSPCPCTCTVHLLMACPRRCGDCGAAQRASAALARCAASRRRPAAACRAAARAAGHPSAPAGATSHSGP